MAGEMAQQLRMLAALTESLSLVPSNHMEAGGSRGSDSNGLLWHCIHEHTHTLTHV